MEEFVKALGFMGEISGGGVKVRIRMRDSEVL